MWRTGLVHIFPSNVPSKLVSSLLITKAFFKGCGKKKVFLKNLKFRILIEKKPLLSISWSVGLYVSYPVSSAVISFVSDSILFFEQLENLLYSLFEISNCKSLPSLLSAISPKFVIFLIKVQHSHSSILDLYLIFSFSSLKLRYLFALKIVVWCLKSRIITTGTSLSLLNYLFDKF